MAGPAALRRAAFHVVTSALLVAQSVNRPAVGDFLLPQAETLLRSQWNREFGIPHIKRFIRW